MGPTFPDNESHRKWVEEHNGKPIGVQVVEGVCPPEWETPCPRSPDDLHCYHWYDDDGPCCFCGGD